MKKVIFLFLFIISTVFLLADSKKIPAKTSNIPEGAVFEEQGGIKYWIYEDKSYPSILWHLNGNIFRMFFETDDKKYLINDYYYENGNPKQKEQTINPHYLNEKHKNSKGPFPRWYAGKQLRYHENGKLKEERCYTIVLQSNKTLKNVLCGPEIFYDETGNEIKRIEHDGKCEYDCDVVPRQSAEKLIAQINSYKQKNRNNSLVRLPVVGKIVSVGSWSKEIEITYKDGFALSVGDQVCCLMDGEFVSFECKSNENGIGKFELKEDKGKKYSSISKDTEPRFYKKNEIKYTDYLKSGSKPKAGDVKIIGGIEFVYIPAGEFYVHDNHDYKKVYKRVIKPFWMTKYEVTLGEFLKYSYEYNKGLPENTSDITFNSRYPVNLGKDYNKAISFCSLFGIKHGVNTELPKDDEWEYAARGGTTTEYYWGNDKIGDYAWYKKNSGGKLHPVGEKKPNAFGLYDMVGNAWEWYGSLFIRGGGCRSDESDLQYTVNYMIHFELADSLKMPEPHKDKTSQGTSFRMIIREAE